MHNICRLKNSLQHYGDVLIVKNIKMSMNGIFQIMKQEKKKHTIM